MAFVDFNNKHKYKIRMDDSTVYPNIKIIDDWNNVKEFEFNNDHESRQFVNALYKHFGGVSDYIILLAHKNYKNATEELERLLAVSSIAYKDIFKIRLELPYQYLIDVYNMKEEEVWDRIEDLVDKDYLEYGVNIRYAWLTEKGEKYFKELRDVAKESQARDK